MNKNNSNQVSNNLQEFTGKPIFVETIPIIGEVPMVFYIPDNTTSKSDDHEKRKLCILIEKYGGMISEFHECFTYQLEPISDPLTQKHFFQGDVFQARWIVDSVKDGRLIDRNEYFAYNNQEDHCKRLYFGKNHVRYTITEALKVFSLALPNKKKSKSANFWMQVEREKSLPNRTADSLRNFWKTNEKKGLENYMRTALENNTWYCHAFCKIPKIQLICTINDETDIDFENDFIKFAEQMPSRTTHRQMVIDAKKNPNSYNLNDITQSHYNGRNKNKSQNQEPVESTDYFNSKGQAKQSRQLSTIFNLLDCKKQMEKQQQNNNQNDQEMTIQELQENENKKLEDKENENDLNCNKNQVNLDVIMDAVGNNESFLVDQVFKSGYKVFQGKNVGKDIEEQFKIENMSGMPNYIKQEQENRNEDMKEMIENNKPKELTREDMSGKDAFFALMGIKMMRLSNKYSKSLQDLHDLFYTVSCDWKKLECVLIQHQASSRQNGGATTPSQLFSDNVVQWKLLEDLAVRDDKESESFKHVLDQKGHDEVYKRRIFLEADQ